MKRLLVLLLFVFSLSFGTSVLAATEVHESSILASTKTIDAFLDEHPKGSFVFKRTLDAFILNDVMDDEGIKSELREGSELTNIQVEGDSLIVTYRVVDSKSRVKGFFNGNTHLESISLDIGSERADRLLGLYRNDGCSIWALSKPIIFGISVIVGCIIVGFVFTMIVLELSKYANKTEDG